MLGPLPPYYQDHNNHNICVLMSRAAESPRSESVIPGLGVIPLGEMSDCNIVVLHRPVEGWLGTLANHHIVFVKQCCVVKNPGLMGDTYLVSPDHRCRGWYFQVTGESKSTKKLTVKRAQTEAKNAQIQGRVKYGYASASISDMNTFCDRYEREHPAYNLLSENCQHFADRFFRQFVVREFPVR